MRSPKNGTQKITFYNKFDNALKISQIFGNTLEALIGAVFLDKGYKKTQQWVEEYIIYPHMFTDDLEVLEINIKTNSTDGPIKTGSRWNSPRWKKRSNTGEGCLPLPLPLTAK